MIKLKTEVEHIKKIIDRKMVFTIMYIVTTNFILVYNLSGFEQSVWTIILIIILIIQIIWLFLSLFIKNDKLVIFLLDFIFSTSIYKPTACFIKEDSTFKNRVKILSLRELLNNINVDNEIFFYKNHKAYDWEDIDYHCTKIKKRNLMVVFLVIVFGLMVTSSFFFIIFLNINSYYIILSIILLRHIFLYSLSGALDRYFIVKSINSRKGFITYYFTLKYLYNSKSSMFFDPDKNDFYPLIKKIYTDFRLEYAKLNELEEAGYK